ncbi:MAG: hypothetical protein ACI87W_000761 [Halieaceae bacterium]|jgi:hypothetical protein
MKADNRPQICGSCARHTTLWGSIALLLGLLLTLPASPLQAAADESSHEVAHGESHDEAFHQNVLAVFTGITHEGRNEDELALGIEYERRLSESFGIGGLLEHTFGELDFWVYAVPFAFHSGPWKLYVAPGIEEKDGERDELLRVGVEYGFEVGGWEIAPQFDIDFVDGEEVIVLGVTFGWGF